MSGRFPWAMLLRLGLRELGLAPADFWSMTLKELAAALPPCEAMTRVDLDALIERFPDE